VRAVGHHRQALWPVRIRRLRLLRIDDFEKFLAGPDLGLTLIRPARQDEKNPRDFANWLRQR
jgi:hypothetical protein